MADRSLRRPLRRSLRRAPAGLLAAVLALATLSACSGGDGSDDPETGGTSASPSASPSASGGASGEGTEAEEVAAAEPVLLGDQPLIQPCRLVDLDAVEQQFGPMPKQGVVEQHYPTASVTGAAWEQASVNDSVEASCSYSWGDGHSLRVRVDHYESEERAKAQWAAIAYLGTGAESRELAGLDFPAWLEWVKDLQKELEADTGGEPVAGAKHLLYVPGRQHWVTWRDNALITLSWSRPVDVFRDEPLSPQEYRFQAPRMKALTQVARTADVTDQTPLPVQLANEETFEGTPYLEPCALADDEVVTTLVQWEPTVEVRSYSTERDVRRRARQGGDAPFYRSPGASCEREAEGGPTNIKTRSVEVEVRYAADARRTQKLIGEWAVDNFYTEEYEKKYGLQDLVAFRMATPRASDADWLYILDTKEVSSTRVVKAYAAVGPYVVRLVADRGLAGGDLRQVDADSYVAAVDLVAARIRELTDDCGGDCPVAGPATAPAG
ncbi:hypothetical protein [Nocardioides marmotae]|uniref:hypothetical protein n=1 Tax=Nocardioides marmotae TaxID=2663857 RepID=UPI0012B5A27C|nr:hypothetical protein [Nocardioides marmotae]MBC9733917.1 hypothetical protein [Nocardioides marmotae]MTB85020.1 hypothetical protein [Nocardioides marmotae]